VLTVAALLLVVVLASARVWIPRRRWPFGDPGSSTSAASRVDAPGPTRLSVSDTGRRARTAWHAAVLLGVLLLAYAWASGQVIEEARIYAEVHGMPANDGAPERARQQVAAACAVVLLLGAVLFRSSVGARRREV
jgi:hypothetical protein